jgi:pyruvate-formate lyase-activating enzyme
MTNECQLRCRYCYAAAGERAPERLSLAQARAAIDYVRRSAEERGATFFEVAFHGGGEPTLNWSVLQESVAYARRQPLPARINLTSNGIWSARQRRWILDNLDSVNLSVDGGPATQDRERPFPSGEGSSPAVMRTLAALDGSDFSYGIRMTATAPWERFPEDVGFLCAETGCRDCYCYYNCAGDCYTRTFDPRSLPPSRPGAGLHPTGAVGMTFELTPLAGTRLPVFHREAAGAARLVLADCRARGRPFTLVIHGGGEPTVHFPLLRAVLDAVEGVIGHAGVPVFRYLATNGSCRGRKPPGSPATSIWSGSLATAPPTFRDGSARCGMGGAARPTSRAPLGCCAKRAAQELARVAKVTPAVVVPDAVGLVVVCHEGVEVAVLVHVP